MDCGAGVRVCGVLALQSGLGHGVYGGGKPAIHGLWPQEKRYGNSQCIEPSVSRAKPTRIYSCYEDSSGDVMWFQNHEWTKHGSCAGVKDVDDYFGQVCSLAKAPLAAMAAHTTLERMAAAVELAGFEIFDKKADTAELLLSACVDILTGKWVLAPAAEFRSRCGGIHAGGLLPESGLHHAPMKSRHAAGSP